MNARMPECSLARSYESFSLWSSAIFTKKNWRGPPSKRPRKISFLSETRLRQLRNLHKPVYEVHVHGLFCQENTGVTLAIWPISRKEHNLKLVHYELICYQVRFTDLILSFSDDAPMWQGEETSTPFTRGGTCSTEWFCWWLCPLPPPSPGSL